MCAVGYVFDESKSAIFFLVTCYESCTDLSDYEQIYIVKCYKHLWISYYGKINTLLLHIICGHSNVSTYCVIAWQIKKIDVTSEVHVPEWRLSEVQHGILQHAVLSLIQSTCSTHFTSHLNVTTRS